VKAPFGKPTDTVGPIPIKAVVFMVTFVEATTSRIGLLPCVVLSAVVCAAGREAADFGTLTTIRHLGSLVESAFSIFLFQMLQVGEPGIVNLSWHRLWLLVVLCSALGTVALVCVPFIGMKASTDGLGTVNDDEDRVLLVVTEEG